MLDNYAAGGGGTAHLAAFLLPVVNRFYQQWKFIFNQDN